MPSAPACFAVLWDPVGIVQRAYMGWASRRGVRVLFSAGAVVGFATGSRETQLRAWSGNGSCGVVLGELYEPERIRRELGKAGVAAIADDEAALILRAYAAWGESCFRFLDGAFCTVLWDSQRGRLVLYRDATCARSLYWYQGERWAAVASRLDLLTTIPGVGRHIGGKGLHEYLRFLDISPPNTIYADVRAIEAGVPAAFLGDQLTYGPARAMRRPCVPHRPGSGSPPSFESSVDALDQALHSSVRARLAADFRTGAFLSGGIDSALVCAIAADIDRSSVEGFTLGFQERAYDETPVAQGIAKALGIRHHCFRYKMAEFADAFDSFLAAIDFPFADPAGLPTFLLYHDCRTRVDAVLDGTGADTLLGVMPARYLRIATQYAALLPAALRHAFASIVRYWSPLAGYAPIFDFDAPEELLIRWKGWSRTEIEALCGCPVSFQGTRFFRIYRSFPSNAHFERYSALLGNLPDDRVHQSAEVASLKIRFPYWDERVERLIAGLPLNYRFTQAEPKRILRALLARYVPQPLWDVPKHGFDFPFLKLLRYQNARLVKRYLDCSVTNSYPLFRDEVLRAYVSQFLEGDDKLAFRIWALVVLFGWLSHHR